MGGVHERLNYRKGNNQIKALLEIINLAPDVHARQVSQGKSNRHAQFQ